VGTACAVERGGPKTRELVQRRKKLGAKHSDSKNLLARARSDELLGRVVRNSALLFSSNSAALAVSVLQGILAARMLGPSGYGLIGIVMSYASTVNGLLSFRMGELVVRYGGEYLEKGEKSRVSALVRLAAISELAVSVLAFAAVFLTASLASRFATKTPGTEWMFVVYGLGLLCNFNVETATGVLQITDKIRTRGTLNLIQALFSGLFIVAAYLWNARTTLDPSLALRLVLVAYLVGKAILGIGMVAVAVRILDRLLGKDWSLAPATALPYKRELFRFAFSSNLSATAILVFRESEVLWVGLFLNSEAAGLYKVAYMIVALLSVPADPLILSSYPEANRLIVQRAWKRLKDFLRKLTTIALTYNMLLGLALVVAGRAVLTVFGPEYVVAYPAVLVLLVGMIFNYGFFWNRPLLLSFGLQGFALFTVILAGLIKLVLAVPLVPQYGFVMEAGLLSAFYLISVGLNVARGLRELRRRSIIPVQDVNN
jgi:O-antigen/teichoic acid export membrane protein